MTRAERYKRNYRIIQNTYHDSKLSKKYQTHSVENIYKELGINVEKKTPILKKTTKTSKVRGARNLEHFTFGIEIGLEVKEAKKLASYRKSKITSTHTYHDVVSKKRVYANKKRRLTLWEGWSEHDNKNMPPQIDKQARDINRDSHTAKRKLDDFDHYGYVVAFYMFIENKTMDEIKDIIKPDPHDIYKVRYQVEVIGSTRIKHTRG